MISLVYRPHYSLGRLAAATSRSWRSSSVNSGASAVQVLRSHMNHGGGGGGELKLPLESPGPRTAGVEIGLDTATSSHNILRLLESSHGQYSHLQASVAFNSTVWHPKGQIWEYSNDDENDGNGCWKMTATTTTSDQGTNDNLLNHNNIPTTPARLLDIKFSDSRTALVKLIGNDGRQRYLSLLQLEECKPLNDGWILVREVIGGAGADTTTTSCDRGCSSTRHRTLQKVIMEYLSIEHGGGLEDKETTQQVFHPQSTLMAVGSCSDHDAEANSEWSAPVGSLLEISLETYMNGVLFQTIHDYDSTRNDSIVALDVLPCGTAAAATVRVGNGSQTRIFEDHLLVGRCRRHQDNNTTASATNNSSNADRYTWQILSKTFSPQAWPLTPMEEAEEIENNGGSRALSG